ncbi:MAG TPA: cytochrome c [Gemmatimonadaceae bacterium]|nr:cytochrome c [Gemmatimonadaceae bacterium]
MIRKILKWTGITIVALVAIVVATVAARWDRTFDVPTPELKASSDPAVIARGRYLAYGPAHCSDCHAGLESRAVLAQGGTPPLSGGMVFDIPPGVIRVPNITPDSATGIGTLTDGQIARMIRYGVRHDGRAALPFMEFNNMNDSDIVAVMSFLRSQAPASHAVEPTDLNWMGKAVTAFMLEPLTPAATPVANRGEYIVDALANCAGCHTQRSMVSGAFTGPRLRGGIPMESSVNAAIKLTPPDLTGNPGGRTAMWTEDEFVARFHAGERIPGSPMPWQAFGRMSEEDVRSIYRYLKSVP